MRHLRVDRLMARSAVGLVEGMKPRQENPLKRINEDR